jgi:hypothetical protein
VKPISPARAILYGALAVGILDGLDALVFFGLRGAPPIRIFQGIAGGLLGRASFDGGIATALLGVAIHFCIATTIVVIYYVAAKWIPVLTRHPIVCGAVYGVGAYFVMNLVVLPLSAAGGGLPKALPVLVNGLFAHIFFVGIPSAWAARLGLRA